MPPKVSEAKGMKTRWRAAQSAAWWAIFSAARRRRREGLHRVEGGLLEVGGEKGDGDGGVEREVEGLVGGGVELEVDLAAGAGGREEALDLTFNTA